MEFCCKRLICSFGEKRFFFKNSQHSHWLFKHFNAFLQIHSKVHHCPLNTFSHVFFLFQHKHVVVEKLLELFVGEIDADLLKPVVVKYLKTCNVQNTYELDPLHGRVNQGLVTHLHHKLEGSFIQRSGNTSHRGSSLDHSLAFGHPFNTNLQLWLTEVVDHPLTVNS